MPEQDFTPPQPTEDVLQQLGAAPAHTGAPGSARMDEFFGARESLQRLLEIAAARCVSPWALLGVVLARVVAATEPHLVLPPMIGGDGSLNMFVALVGHSGQGKGAAYDASEEEVRFVKRGSKLEVDTDTVSPGSGEGLVKLFPPARREQDEGQPQVRSRALVNESEITSTQALSNRTGGTLVPTLLKMWGGEQVGFTNADIDRSTSLEAHTYRLCMISQVQPGNAPALLAHEESGLPQRFVWLPARLPSNLPEAETTPPPLEVEITNYQSRTEVEFPPSVKTQIRSDYRNRAQAEFGAAIDPLKGHYNLLRLKVAAALALLDGRRNVTEEDWELSQCVMDVHTDTIEMVRSFLRKKQRDAVAAKAEREEQAKEERRARREERAKNHILKRVCAITEPTTVSEVKRRAKGDIRGEVATLLDEFADMGLVTITEEGTTRFVHRLTADQEAGIKALL